MEEESPDCWACGESRANKVRVISNGDNALSFLKAKGLINFDTFSWSRNSVPLCPTCHEGFSDSTDPHFAFWPEDLDFFIRFEMRDRARRRRLPLQSQPASGAQNEERKRRVPTTNQYRMHMHRKKTTEGDGKSWGTYYHIYLVDSWRSRIVKNSPIKEWGGAPFAALRRAIRILGCPRSARIPRDVIEKLQTLRDLYYGDEDMEAQLEVEKRYGLDPFAEADDDIDNLAESGDDEGDNDDDDDAEGSAPPKKRRKIVHLGRRSETSSEVSFDYTNWTWRKYGPESSSENNRLKYLSSPRTPGLL